MIAGGAPGGHSKRRNLEAEINLVPFIDLLSMCICFLLMTAVWIQLGALEVKQSHGTEADVTSASLDMDLKFLSPTSLELGFSRGKKGAKKEALHAQSFAALVAALDSRIEAAAIRAAGSRDPKATAGTLISSAMLTPTKSVSYGDMVLVMDLLRKHRIVNLGVVPVGG